MKRLVGLMCVFILLISCAPQIQSLAPTSLPSTASEAQKTLIKFFDLLNTKQYTEADSFYGGSYEQLRIFHPDADVFDHATLWSNACEVSGLQCLKVRTATLENQQGDTYAFQVEFNNPDSSLFVLGPCCGANETDMPPVSQFEYRVARNDDGKFLVMEIPPYVP